MLGLATLRDRAWLSTFAELIIKLFSGEGWNRAYYYSFARPISVRAVDYLELIKPNGEVGIGNIKNLSNSGNYAVYWVREGGSSLIEWIQYSPLCHGVPALAIFTSVKLDMCKQVASYTEQWLMDDEKKHTLQICLDTNFPTKLYPADADFFSPTLGKMVNLAPIFNSNDL
jgi:hypothetical protein